jgi:signal transduction histidine kinase
LIEEHLPWRAELIDRIYWMVQLRWLAVIGSVAVIIVASVRLPGVLPVIHLLALSAAIAVYNIVFYVYAHEIRSWTDQEKKLRCATILVHAQILLDLACLTLLLHYSGGVESPFSTYFVLHIILASILLSRLASFLYATLATIMYAAMVLAEYAGLIFHVHLVSILDPDLYHRETFIVAAIFALFSTLFFAVYIASSITSQLRNREKELAEARFVCEIRSDELARVNEQLTKLDEMKTRFLLTVTHELRAPVAAIQNYLDLILQGYVGPEKQTEVLERSRNRTEGLLELIADLLEMARIREIDTQHIQTEHVDMAGVMEEVLGLLRGEAEERKQTINVLVEPNLPPVETREDHLKSIWTNLISNAIKYTPEGGQINIEIKKDDHFVQGLVKDTGIGISPEEQSHIFQEFFRTDEAKQMSTRGTGLGLSITKRLVETYKGEMKLQSELGKGSTFTFKLPQIAAS